MAKIMIVPTKDYEILKKYLQPSVVLIPESILTSFPPEAQAKARELVWRGDIDYDFGGEPDISMDVILNEGSYTYAELLGSEGGDD